MKILSTRKIILMEIRIQSIDLEAIEVFVEEHDNDCHLEPNGGTVLLSFYTNDVHREFLSEVCGIEKDLLDRVGEWE